MKRHRLPALHEEDSQLGGRRVISVCRGWLYLVLCVVLLCGAVGCSPYAALEATLSPLGAAWFGDLQRLRGVWRRAGLSRQALQAKLRALAKDRWRRAISVSLQAISRRSVRQEKRWISAVKRFSWALIRASRRAREPLARWALAEALEKLGPHGRLMVPLLHHLQGDPSPWVRRRALVALFALQPGKQVLLDAATRALRDWDVWVRTGFLLALLPDAFAPTHKQLQAAIPALLTRCITLSRAAPTQPSTLPRVRRLQLDLRLRQRCLLLIPYLSQLHQRALRGLVRRLTREQGPLQATAHMVLWRLGMVQKGPVPGRRSSR